MTDTQRLNVCSMLFDYLSSVSDKSTITTYSLNKQFSGDVPPIFLRFRRYFIKNKGV